MPDFIWPDLASVTARCAVMIASRDIVADHAEFLALRIRRTRAARVQVHPLNEPFEINSE